MPSAIKLVIVVASSILAPAFAVAQNASLGTAVNAENGVPIPQAGHDYIQLLSESIDPSSGTVNLTLQVPTPKSRGFSLPFAFKYNSGGVFRLNEGALGSLKMDTICPGNSSSSYTTLGNQCGWSYAYPHSTYTPTQYQINYTQGTATCYYNSGYTFTDPSGVTHNLGLGAAWDSKSAPCPHAGSVYSQGGDSQVYAYYPTPLTKPPLTWNVKDGNGNVYYFSKSNAIGTYLPDQIEDRNGNFATSSLSLSGSTYALEFTDSAGRTSLSISGTAKAGGADTVATARLAYTVHWTSTSVSYSMPINYVTPTPAPGSGSCPTVDSMASGTLNVVSSIVLPNGRQYTFYSGNNNPDSSLHNPYGLLNEIIYPDGGWVKYTYKASDQYSQYGLFAGVIVNSGSEQSVKDLCGYQYSTPVVATRAVSFDGTTEALQQTFTYSTTFPSPDGDWTRKATLVSTTDVVTGKTQQSVYTYLPKTIPSAPYADSVVAGQAALENTIQVYDWGSTSTPLSNITKQWLDPFTLTEQDTTVNGLTSKITYSYQALALGTVRVPQEIDEYDFNQSTPTRKTINTYPTSTSTSLIGTACKTVIQDGHNNQVSETDRYFDGSSSLCGLLSSGGATAAVSNLFGGTHDDINFGPASSIPRGNVTKATRWNSAGAPDTSTYGYDETGQLVSSIDGCGNTTCGDMQGTAHTTTYSYADNFSDTSPSGQTNAYLTQVTHPLANGVPHIEGYQYRYVDGQLSHSQDQNRNLTYYVYNSPPSTCGYSDKLNRVSEIDYPDGGKTTYCYNDAGRSVVTAVLLSAPNTWMTRVATRDGMGNVVQTQLTSDPEGADSVETTYGGIGEAIEVTNPHRSSGFSSLTNGATLYSYDALERPISQTQPDLSVQQWCYDGTPSTPVQSNCHGQLGTSTAVSWVDASDEAGNDWQRSTDGLGRMVKVMEPNGVTQVPSMETDYKYDILDNLLVVNQKGGSTNSSSWRTRTFTYDSLSRLLCAANPEVQLVSCPSSASGTFPAGAITYIYDANNNLASRVAPLPNQTGTATVTTSNTYDSLNRLTGKTYSDGTTPTESYYYDAAPGWMPDLQNVVGRTSYSSNQFIGGTSGKATATTYSYDKMGRVIREWDQTPSTAPGGFYVYPGYDLAGDLTSTTTAAGTILSYMYNAAGQLSLISSNLNDAQHPPTLYAVDSATGFFPNGAVHKASFGNGLTQTQFINDRLQPCRTSLNSSGGSLASCTDATPVGNLLDMTLGYGAGSDNGSISSWTALGKQTFTRKYVYDSLNRIKSMTDTAPTQSCQGMSWTLDPWSNMTAQTPTAGSCYSLQASVGTNNRFQAGYQYDAAGNVTNDGVHIYTYDAENRVIQVDQSSYVYDERGRRVRSNTSSGSTDYFYGPNGSVQSEFNGSWPVQYIYAGDRLVAEYTTDTTNFVYADQIGSTRLVTSVGQGVLDSLDYAPFGQQIAGDSVISHKFTGKERDAESGLDYFGARYFGSSMGRFMSPDSFGGHYTDPQTLNKYSYVRNNPLRYTDPTGHDLQEDCKQTKDNHATCGGSGSQKHVGTTDAKGKFNITHFQTDASGNLAGHDVSFNTNGVHIDGNNAEFISGTDPTRVNGQAGTGWDQTHFVVNSNCNETCAAGGAIFGSPQQLSNLVHSALVGPNKGLDGAGGHEGDQYRGGNKDGPDMHLSFIEGRAFDSMHFDGRYPYGSVGGFADHAWSWMHPEGHHEVPLPQDINPVPQP